MNPIVINITEFRPRLIVQQKEITLVITRYITFTSVFLFSYIS